MILITSILWTIMAITLLIEYAPQCKSLSPAARFAVILVFWIGAPFFVIVSILEVILNCLLPEGWDDEDDFKGY